MRRYTAERSADGIRLVLALFSLAALGGCRDFVMEDGSRVGDHHILRGRTPSNLTSTEISSRRFISRSRDLLPLERALNETLDGRVLLSGGDSVGFAEGSVQRLLADGWVVGTTTLPARTAAATFLGAPFASFRLAAIAGDTSPNLIDEYDRLCTQLALVAPGILSPPLPAGRHGPAGRSTR